MRRCVHGLSWPLNLGSFTSPAPSKSVICVDQNGFDITAAKARIKERLVASNQIVKTDQAACGMLVASLEASALIATDFMIELAFQFLYRLFLAQYDTRRNGVS